MIHLDSDGPLQAATDQDLGAAPGGGINTGTEGGPRPDARPDPVDARHQDVIAAVLGRVVSAPVA